MPARKSKTRGRTGATGRSRSSRARKGKDAVPARLKALVVMMVIVLVGGVAAVKFFQTPRGKALMLDNGFTLYYAAVQEQIGDELKAALSEFDLHRNLHEKGRFTKVGGKSVRYYTWQIEAGAEEALVKVNVALTEAAHRAGATVRRSEERDGGRTLAFETGSQKFLTHRVLVTRAKRTARTTGTPAGLPQVAIVIDDFGYVRNSVTEELLSLDLPITVSVLPSLPQSAAIARIAKKRGRCVLLHLPMEATDEESDLATVKTDMNEPDIAALVKKYIRAVPGIDGVNNHQGSRATEDARVMAAVLSVIKDNKLFFLDSLTSPKSVAYNTAREMGLPTARNGIFLDADTEDARVVEERLREMVARAKKNGTAIGIAHPRRWTLEALQDNELYLKNAGVELVYVSSLMR